MNEQEIEVKFYLHDLARLEQRLQMLGAERITPRVHEVNLRFDLPDGSLTRSHRVVRLRQDHTAHLTYKGPQQSSVVSMRQEIEFEVSSFEAAKHFLEALGYRVSVMYEKYRTTYEIAETQIALDEMPYGNFVEIEAPDAASIEILAAALGLNWQARCTESYLALFERLRQQGKTDAQHLSFEAFKGLQITPQDFGMMAADL